MTIHPSRRAALIGVSAVLAGRVIPARAVSEPAIAAIETRHGGRLGVFVLDTGSGRTLSHRADERFLLCSSFKGLLAAMVLSRVEAGQDDLARLVPYGRKDLIVVSPVTGVHVAQGALSVGDLCAAILVVSDNTAANLLLARVGGPPALTAFLRGLGDTVTRSDRIEPHVGTWNGTMDTTTPRAIVGTARTLLLGDALRPGPRAQLERWMQANVVGRTRLRAAFPPTWSAADRTGTGDGLCNDYALARRPGAAPLVMAAYYDAPGLEVEAQEAVLREVGRTIVTWAG